MESNSQTGNKMKTITEQTGWIRPYPETICQDIDVLAAVSEFSFDITNSEFIEYFRCRTGIIIDEFKTFAATSDKIDDWYLNSLDFKYLYSGEPVEKGECRERYCFYNKIFKGKLQDCWELFKAKFTGRF